jgi:acetyltransferase-like isoleucine patch superfamily enzyme
MFVSFYRLYVRVYARLFTALCRTGFRGIGRGSVIIPPVRLWGEARIEIGTDVFIGRNAWLQVVPSSGNDSDGVVISIGNDTSIVGSCTITAVQRIVIERRVLMAGNVYIADHTHAHISRTIAIKDQGVTNVAPVRICEGAWLGQNVVICPGVTVGRNAVVGANSVVRDDVPDFCVFAGAPARFIRKIDEQRARDREVLETV